MKKLLYLLALLAVVTLALAGCNAEAEPTDTQKPSETQKQTESTNFQPTVAVSSDGYVTVNGVKTEYKVDTEDKITVDTEGYLVVNGVKTEHRVDPRKPCTFGDWQPYGDKIENCASALWFRICSDCKVLEWKEGLEHKFVTVTTKATCQAKGYDTNTCSVCGTVTKTNETPVTDHSYVKEYTTDSTFHWNKCQHCDATSTKTEHTLGTDGICTVCDAVLGATIGVIYDVSADGTYAEVVGYEGTAKRVRIADTYENLPVKNIYSFGKNKTVTEVIIPDSVTSIEEHAFGDCDSLTSITIPDSVTSIGKYAFDGCSRLTSITIPDGITSIEKSVFGGCSNLTNITIPDSVTSIGISAFYYCSSLTSITIPDSVTSIGGGAFCDCDSLTSITIPDSVTSIGEHAFQDCSSLTSITIPDSVTSIGSWVFDGCSSLTFTEYENAKYLGNDTNPYVALINVTNRNLSSYTIHKDTKVIAGYVFSGCSRMTSITIPDSVTSIGDRAFGDCDSLTSITIPDSVTSIGDGAFECCSKLTSITIPDSVTSIGAYAFDACSRLTDVYYTGTEAEWKSIAIYTSNSNLIYATKHYNYVPQ